MGCRWSEVKSCRPDQFLFLSLNIPKVLPALSFAADSVRPNRGHSDSASYSGVHGYFGTTTNGRSVLSTATGTGGTGVQGDAAAGTGASKVRQ